MTKKRPSSKAWLKEHRDDPYVRQAQRDGYRSRACYKLLELQDKDKLPAPLKSLDLRSVFKSGIKEGEEANSPSQTDRIIQQTVGITSSPGGTPGDRVRAWAACTCADCDANRC